jgi:dTMP kinase
MEVKKMYGMLIAIEGIDGSGKSTFVKYLADRLKKEGHQVVTVTTRQTQKEHIFQKIINGYRVDPHSPAYMFLFQFLHALKAERTRQFLKEGKIVIADRWDLSFFVYHENLGFFTKESDNLRKEVSRLAFGDMRPHLGIYLDVSAGKAIDRRIWRGEIIYNSEAERKFYEKVTVNYKFLAQRHGWIIVDAENKFKQVWKTVWKLVQGLVK